MAFQVVEAAVNGLGFVAKVGFIAQCTGIFEHPTTQKVARVVGCLLGVGIAVAVSLYAGFTIGAAVLVVGGLSLAGKCLYDLCTRHDDVKNLTAPFQNIDSSTLKMLQTSKKIADRSDFLKSGLKTPPPIIGKSHFVPNNMLSHLMRDKKNFAHAQKYHVGDAVTNMEGALHTFVTPVCPKVSMVGDYRWMGKASPIKGKSFGDNKVREVILSATIHPDFEYDTVLMPLVKVRDEAVEGKHSELRNIPSASTKKNATKRERYETELLQHMVYHLSPDHRIPARKEIRGSQILDSYRAQKLLESLISGSKSLADRPLKDKYMKLKLESGKESLISLEILFQVYVEQIRAEFKALNPQAPQGYVYTISPPVIFAKYLGNAKILNRLQALAFKSLRNEHLFSNMRVMGYGDYADKSMLALIKKSVPQGVQVVSQDNLFDRKDGVYKGPKGLALVLHNNSDAFGQNIEFEGKTSMDGVIGVFSDAACVLKRNRSDLLHHVV